MKKGIAYVLFASICLGMLPYATYLGGLAGLTTNSSVLYRMIFASLSSLLLCITFKLDLMITKVQLCDLLLFGVTGSGLTALLLMTSYNYIPSGIASMLHFSFPILVMIAMRVVYREKLTAKKMISIVVAFSGIVLLGAGEVNFNLSGVMLALGSAITYTFFIIANKKSEIKKLNPIVVSFYMSTANSVVFIIKGIFLSDFVWIDSIGKFGAGMFLGLICTTIPMALLAKGIREIGPNAASVLNMLEPVVCVFVGILLLGEKVTLLSALGCGCIIFSVVVIVLDAKKIGANI